MTNVFNTLIEMKNLENENCLCKKIQNCIWPKSQMNLDQYRQFELLKKLINFKPTYLGHILHLLKILKISNRSY